MKKRWLYVYAGALALIAAYAAMEHRFAATQVELGLEAADAAMAIARGELDRRGALAVDSTGALFAGRTALADDERIVDQVAKVTGFDCTLFAADLRVASSARVRGGRNVGTRAPAAIAARVLRRGETVRGRSYGYEELVTRYDPLQTRDGRIVGMVAVYRASADFLGGRAVLRGVFAAMFAVAAALAIALARRAS